MRMGTNIEKTREETRMNGLRRSSSREAILSILAASRRPVSVADIMSGLAERGKRFNKTTVYRELETLKKTRDVRELFLRNDTALYELSGTHHHHALCVACGEIEHIELPEPKEWVAEKFFLKDGFRITDHSLEFFGMCRKCRLL